MATSQFLNLVLAISLHVPDKICILHISISLNDVCQEELIVDIIVTTRQTGETIPQFIVQKDTCLDPDNNVAVIVCQHHFQHEVGKKNTLNKTYKIKNFPCTMYKILIAFVFSSPQEMMENSWCWPHSC
jgi:hypothetical protein